MKNTQTRTQPDQDNSHQTGTKDVPIGEIGGNHVTDFLDQWRFRINRIAETATSMDIEATNSTQRLLVHVKTSRHPAQPTAPTPDEIRTLTTKAAQSGREPWQASVTVNEEGLLTQNIRWIRLT